MKLAWPIAKTLIGACAVAGAALSFGDAAGIALFVSLRYGAAAIFFSQYLAMALSAAAFVAGIVCIQSGMCQIKQA